MPVMWPETVGTSTGGEKTASRCARFLEGWVGLGLGVKGGEAIDVITRYISIWGLSVFSTVFRKSFLVKNVVNPRGEFST